MVHDSSFHLHNIRIDADQTVGITVRDGVITDVSAGQTVASDELASIDGANGLILPALVDGHMHVDKTLFGQPWLPYPAGPDRESRIETEKQLRNRFPAPVEDRAAALLRQVITTGTGALRTHVDIDLPIGLAHLHAILALRDRFKAFLDIQIVAFPQSGIARSSGMADLLDAAVAEGADLVGGIDPIGFDEDLTAHYDVIFGIAERHGVGIDIHLHDAGPTGVKELDGLIERTRAAGLEGQVTASHAFCVGGCDEATFERLAAALAEAKISIATHGGGASPLPPVKKLRDRGVSIFAGNDNIRDTWTPYGNGDMLERAMLTAWRSGFRTDEDLEIALDLASGAGAKELGLAGHGLDVGCAADFFVVDADTPAHAVADRPVRRMVFKRGRLVARDGALTAQAEAELR